MLAIEGFPSKIVNAYQLMVGDTLLVITQWMDVIHKPRSEVHPNVDARISESPDSRFGKSR
jgi:hypothetical protein